MYENSDKSGTKRIVYGWSGEEESNVNATVTKNCHNRHCMIYYTQLPLWFLVIIALSIGQSEFLNFFLLIFFSGISWECYSITGRYQEAFRQQQEDEAQGRAPSKRYNPVLLSIAGCCQKVSCFSEKNNEPVAEKKPMLTEKAAV